MEDEEEESGLREAKPSKASLTDGVWLLRAWRGAVAEKRLVGICGTRRPPRSRKDIRDFQSPDLGDSTVVGSFTGTDTAWGQKQCQGNGQLLSIQESEMPVVSLPGVAAG